MRIFKKTRNISICVVLFLLSIPGFLFGINDFNSFLTEQSLDYEQERSKISAYTSLAPIYIDGNFSAAKIYYGWSGSGTSLSPYIIENISITGYSTSVGLSIYNSNDYFIVKDSEFRNLLMGIDISNSYFGKIDNVTIAQNLDGINIDGSTITIQNSKLQQNMDYSSNYAYGIYAYNSNVTILNNYIYYSEYGIYNGGNGNYATIKDNDVVSNTQYGIYSFATISNVTIENNYIFGTTVSAISVNGPKIHVINNTLEYFGQVGIVVSGTNSVDGLVTRNILQASSTINYHKGIYIYNKANNNLVFNNTIYNCDQYGLYIWDAVSNQIYNNTLINNGVGIYVYSANYNNVSSNIVYSTNYISNTGIKLDTVQHGLFIGNKLFNLSTGIDSVQNIVNASIYDNFLYSVGTGIKVKDNNRVINNTISGAGTSISVTSISNQIINNSISCNSGMTSNGILLYAGYNTITSNTIFECSSGILFRNSPLNNLSFNKFYNSSLDFYDSSVIGDYIQNISSNNLVNEQTLLYYKNVDHVVVSGGNINQIIFANSTNIAIEDTIMTSSRNILSFFNTNVTITNVNISDSAQESIDLYYTTNATISKTIIDQFYTGLTLRYSNNITVTNNTLTFGITAIYISNSLYNTVSYNNIKNVTSDGVKLQSSSNNNSIFYNNVTTLNSGISLTNSDFNLLYKNNFFGENTYTVLLSTANTNTLDSNTFQTLNKISVYISQSTKNIFDNNVLTGSLNIYGTKESDFDFIEVDNNYVNGEPLLYIKNVHGAQYSTDYGQIIIYNSSGITLENQVIMNHIVGIYATFSSNLNIKNSQFIDTDYGIRLRSVSDTTLLNNEFIRNNYGVETIQSSNLKIDSNTFTNDQTAIHSTQSVTSIQIINNLITDSTNEGIYVASAGSGLVDKNTIINTSSEGIFIASASNIQISRNIITDGGYQGLYVLNSNSYTIDNNTISNNADSGVRIVNSPSGTISNSTISTNIIAGIYVSDTLTNPDLIDIRGNEISYNGKGIFFDSILESNITKNNLTYNENAIYYTGSDQNSISSNIFKYNYNYTLYFATSLNNEILANDFLYNNQNGSNGYLTDKNHFVFNYYSDWAEKSTDGNKDNILDDPYVFEGQGNNIDLYPLANSFTESINNTITIIVQNTTYINVPVYNNLTETKTVYTTITTNPSSTTSSETNASDFSLEGILLAMIIFPVIAIRRRKQKKWK